MKCVPDAQRGARVLVAVQEECRHLHMGQHVTAGRLCTPAHRSEPGGMELCQRGGKLIDPIVGNPANIPAVEIVAASPLPSMTDDPTPKTSAPTDQAAIVATLARNKEPYHVIDVAYHVIDLVGASTTS